MTALNRSSHVRLSGKFQLHIHGLFLKFHILNTREDPSSRLAKMGAMATPFKGLDREDQHPLPPEREEPQSETPPGKADSI